MPFTRSNKITVFVAILILLSASLLSGHLFLKNKYGYSALGDQLKYVLGKPILSEAEQKQLDSDGDGLKDWEEKVWRTNPKKSDTDGDGYLDGEEVATGYDPTKKAPNDELAGQSQQSPRPLPKNLTKALSTKLSESLVLGKIRSINKETGQPLTKEELEKEAGLQQVIEEAISQQIGDFLPPEISDEEIKISGKIGKEETAAYLKNLGASLNEMPAQPGSEMQLFLDAMQTHNFSEVEKVRQAYEDSYNKLKALTVPANFVQFHKGVLGVFWVTNNIYKAVVNIDEDPLKATIALMQYRNTIDKTKILAIDLIREEFKYQ